MDLNEIRQEVAVCRDCNLCDTRTNTVFSRGSDDAPVMVIGEAPGFYEDQSGLPFVGKAGILLDKMLDSIGLNETNTYIANILKCRPPENRNPDIDEIRKCGVYLQKQIEAIKPKFIITTGAFSTSYLLDKDFDKQVKITAHVGKLYEYNGIPFMPIFHPAYLLRNEDKKEWTWKNLQEIYGILEKMGIYNNS